MSLPHGWNTTPIGEAGKWLSGGTPSTGNSEYWNGDIPWISSGSLTNFRLTTSDRKVTAKGAENGTRMVQPRTILMVVRGMSLKSEFRIGVAMRPMTFGQDCKALVAGESFDPTFLAYAILAQTPKILGIVDEAGHGTGRLNSDQLYAVEIGVPPMPEQRAIAEVLGALDDKIAANTKLATTTTSLMTELIASYSATVPLSDVVDHRKTSRNPSALSRGRVAHFSLPAFDLDKSPEVCEPSTIKSNKFLIDKPSVLISKLNPRFPRIWDVATLPGMMSLASTEFLVLEPKSISTAVLFAILSQPSFSASLQTQVAGTSSSHQRVKPSDLMATRIPNPAAIPESVLAQITSLGAHTALMRLENKTLSATRDALLPQLMSGKLRVKDAEPLVSAAV
ncbi:type I restriction enzyme S subunit [Arthrobacter stackebrandtii]|uniref:Type I restriction enzyme S subunit n=1 Tax=Arthrobacter stackebrandtii TaxID=272161 RepID=A0ABS4YU07_9MICC|nr:restriction endonuclease subunit S [Arthrobacter stackebrandtii]MBP2412276.1 type I restriction enzyme S subunit [Arthrobacter stackebrandtii]PYH02059.1 hypothetical protein CVV67_01035 [Arthrobacter stackebrandtii]